MYVDDVLFDMNVALIGNRNKTEEPKEEDPKPEVKKEKERERHTSLSDAVLQEYEEVQKENKRLHNLVTELHKKHHDISIKVNIVINFTV